MKVVKTREVLMCVHDEPVNSCTICQGEIANGHEVPVRSVTVVKKPVAIQIIQDEE